MSDLRTAKQSLEKNLHELGTENTSLKRIKDNWNEDKLNLQHVIEKRDLEIARLNGEIGIFLYANMYIFNAVILFHWKSLT